MKIGPNNMPREFAARLENASRAVDAARASGDMAALARALSELGNVQRRPPWLRDDADRSFAEAASIFNDIGMPLEAAWAIRHIGIDHEYAGRLIEAETAYDRSLAIFREHAKENSLDYANTVRYPAVVKNRLGKRAESEALWTEALERYEGLGLDVAIAEAAAWLAIFAIEGGDLAAARSQLAKAETAAAAAGDPDTDTFIEKVRARLNVPGGGDAAIS